MATAAVRLWLAVGLALRPEEVAVDASGADLVYRCGKGHTEPLQSDKYSGELVLAPLELINRINRIAQLVPPLRAAVTATSAGCTASASIAPTRGPPLWDDCCAPG